MQIGLSGIGLQDREIAEAILEHRHTLGGSAESVMVVQGGFYEEDDLIKAIVVDGVVVAYEGTCHHPNGFAVASSLRSPRPKRIGASFVGVTLAHSPDGLVVWDVRPTPDFRQSIPTGTGSVAGAVVELVQRNLAGETRFRSDRADIDAVAAGNERTGERRCPLCLTPLQPRI